MRICLVTPYPWDRPSEPNDHLGALAGALSRRGHEVVVLATATRPAALRDGRHRIRLAERGDRTALTGPAGSPLVLAVGLAPRGVAISPGMAAAIRLVLDHGRFDVVDALDPDVPGAASIALRESPAPTVATFFRGGPPRRTPRAAERLAARADAVIALSPAGADTALRRFGVQPEMLPPAVDTDRFAPTPPATPPLVVVETTIGGRAALRPLFAELASTTAEIALLRTGGVAAGALRALVPSALAERVRTPPAGTTAERAAALRGASVFVADAGGSALTAREAAAAGVPIVAVTGSAGAAGIEHGVDGLLAPSGEPAIVGALTGRLLADAPLRDRLAIAVRALGLTASAEAAAERLERIYAVPRTPRRTVAEPPDARILCDFHMHTEHSHDCATPVAALVHHAVACGLGAIAVTDHNTIAGGIEAKAYVEEHGIDLHVIVGSEIKTATGEVIGLYLTAEIPRGMPFADTVEAIRAQGALVYVPHPFDRMHAICDPALLRRLVDQIDIFETCNARLYRESFNREAELFAERHDLLPAAGSDAHVLEGLGTGVVELPPFDDAESLLIALGSGRIVRRPASLVYLQGLKWVRQARKRRGGGEH
jgi:predicted metal-dependent phosphoesterase TrpH/glycosyltransferase involved in cell wall biosynthesis